MVPIAGADWETTKTFTATIAAAMAADSPKLYLAKMTKALRHGRIFIDYLRNTREATSVAALFDAGAGGRAGVAAAVVGGAVAHHERQSIHAAELEENPRCLGRYRQGAAETARDRQDAAIVQTDSSKEPASAQRKCASMNGFHSGARPPGPFD